MTRALRYSVSTLLVAAIAVPYIGYLVRGTMPFIQDPRGMASTGLVLGAAAVIVAGRDAFGEGWALAIGIGLGAVALGLGVAAVWLEWNTLVLAAFMASIGLVWAFEAVRNFEAYAHARHAGQLHA